jgi:hypothetical protein
MARARIELATPRFSVVDRGAPAGHGRRLPPKISLQIGSIASIATCGPLSRDTALVRARGRRVDVRELTPPGSARVPMRPGESIPPNPTLWVAALAPTCQCRNHARGALSGAPDQMPLSWGRSTLPGGREGARFSSREARLDAVSRRSLLKGAAARRQVPRLRRCPVVVLSGSSLISDARCEDGEPISPRSPRTARRRLPWACDHRRR